jgi:dTDP-4-amino-4,6-dideoxygalactose transaminase
MIASSPSSLLPFALPDIGDREVEEVTACLRSGWLTTGRKCREFEELFAEYVRAEHAIAVSSATNAALLVMDAIGVGPGWEVLVPSYTFSGPAMMAHKLGADVRFIDVAPGSYQMDPAGLEAALSQGEGRLRVVMPTHFAGQSCDMRSIVAIAKAKGCWVFDDAAHALPTFDKEGRMVGDQGADATFYSFYATKTLTTGEGGMIVTRDSALGEKVRSLRSHGFSRPAFDRYTNPKTGWLYDVSNGGWKANLTDIAAAIGIVQLSRLKDMTERRRDIAEAYVRGLSGEEGIVLPSLEAGHSWHLFPIQVDVDRDEFIEHMSRLGVQCSVHFIPLHLHSFWKSHVSVAPESLKNTEEMFYGEVSLPVYSKMTSSEVEFSIACAKTAIQSSSASLLSKPGTGSKPFSSLQYG